jgi:Holliday junction resolvasome RuvABC endonuclease subunit
MPTKQVPRLFRTRADAAGTNILGIDASLSSTGFAYRKAGTLVTGHVETDDLQGPWRLSYIRRKIEGVLLECGKPDLVVYEDYAMAGKGRVHHIGELGGVLKTLLWEQGIDVLLVGPSVLKKIIIGKGKVAKGPAGKREMVEAIKRLGYRVPQFDEADACALMLVGEIKTGAPTIAADVRQSLRLDSLRDCELVKGKLQSIAK